MQMVRMNDSTYVNADFITLVEKRVGTGIDYERIEYLRVVINENWHDIRADSEYAHKVCEALGIEMPVLPHKGVSQRHNG